MYRQRSSGNWEVIIKDKQFFREIGYSRQAYTVTVDSEAEAAAIDAKLKRMIKNRQIPVGMQQQIRKSKTYTVADIYAAMKIDTTYHESKANKGYTKTIFPDVKDIVIDEYTLNELKAYIATMKTIENTPGTIKKKIGAFKAIFTYAVNQEYLEYNIFDKLPDDYAQHENYKDKDNKNVIRDEERERRLEKGEEKEIRKAIANFKLDPRREILNPIIKPALELMFDIALNTGMRLQEIFLMQWNHINFDKEFLGIKGFIGIPKQNTKKEYERKIPISTKLRPILKQYKLQHGKKAVFVLPFYEYYRMDKEKCSNSISKTWQRILKDFSDLTFHDFRHEAISRMVENTTLELHILQDISGHKSYRTFKRYNQMRLEDKKHGKFY